MNRLVATFNFGPVWYAEYTIPYMRRYAQKVGADFVEYKSFRNWGCYSSHPGWFHVEAIRILADQSYYGEMLLLDADALVMPQCPDLFALTHGRISVVQDMGIPEVDGPFKAWCRKHFSAEPEPGPYFNAGVLVIPRDEAKRVAPRLVGPYPDEPVWENHYLNLKLRQLCQLTFLPHRMNWLAPQFTEASLSMDVVHFVGGSKDLLPAFTKKVCSAAEAASVGTYRR